MIRRHFRTWCAATAATLTLAAAFTTSMPTALAQDDRPSAHLSDELSAWAQAADGGAARRVIVTFHDLADVDLIDPFGPIKKLTHLPMAFTDLTAAEVTELAADPAVRSLWHEERNEVHLSESVPLSRAPEAWAGTGLDAGYTGAGVGVAVIDTGVDGLHPDLPYPEKVEPYILAGDTEDPEMVEVFEAPTGDTYGHGTHVSSTVAGLGVASGTGNTGMAPDARIYSFKTDTGAFLFTGPILRSFDWILAHREEKNIRVSTNSWGSGGGDDFDPDDPVNVATKALFDNGISVVFSAGNNGEPDSLNRYSVAPWVISAAANDKDRALAAFSSRGRLADNWDRRKAWSSGTGVYRPTLSAPGVDIVAAASSHATVMATGRVVDDPMYISASGTSMSAPHIAGALALMYEADPGLTPERAIAILEHTASDMPGYEVFEVGAGHLDAYAAVAMTESARNGFPPPVGRGGSYTTLESHEYAGTALPGSYSFSDCTAGEDHAYTSYHEFTVANEADAIYVTLEWADEQQLIYLFLYDPECNEAGSSAGLLDLVFTRNERVLMVTNPGPGDWTVGIYGRINLPTDYEGTFSTFQQQ